jgi:hypothetical protein
MKKGLMLILIFLLVLSFACSKNTSSFTADCSGATKSFSSDVSPIIQSSCATNAGCHASGSVNRPGALTTYSQIFNARSDIRSAVSSGAMPQNGSLTTTQKNSIICWIDNGALNNYTSFTKCSLAKLAGGIRKPPA